MQRLETAELAKILAAEIRKLQSAADGAAGQSGRARELHGEISRQESELASTMEGVGALFSLLNTALEDESFVKHAEAAVEIQTALENEAIGYGDDSGGKKGRSQRKRGGGGGGPQSVAARVRATSHRNRTPDEKKWVALDAVVNPRLYHHVTLAEAEEMRWDALYYTRLDREDVLRVLSLPPQVQLALPFLHTPDEVAAHELLSRYSLGINADHFSRLDKNSQDECRRTKTASSYSSSSSSSCSAHGMAAAATAGTGDNDTADGTTTKGGQINSGDDDNIVGATRRVLACMLRSVEAKLKIPAERDDEEAVWCVLDQKLRPDLYRDSDEAAADRAEELHREADAREDARHAWLTTPEVEASAGSRGGTMMGSVVEQKREADEHAAAQKLAEDREALVVGVTDSFSEDDIKALAAAAAGESVGAGKLGLGLVTTAAVGREVAAREQEEGRGSTTTSAGMNDREETFAVATATAASETEKHADEAQRRANRQTTKYGNGDDDDDDDGETSKKKECKSEERKQRRRLVEVVDSVLPRFLVAEEETPLGRDMTRSLAMLQEVALRLGRGQRNIFSGLNPQSALALLRNRPSSGTASSTEEDSSAPAAAAAATVNMAAAAAGNGRDGVAILENAAEGDQAITSSNAETQSPLSGERKSSSADSLDAKQPPCGETKSTSESESWGDSGGNGDGGSTSNTGGGSTVSNTPQKLEKVFGSWEEVHPAALGIASQEKQFLAGEGGRVHPASFRSSPRSTGAQKRQQAVSA